MVSLHFLAPQQTSQTRRYLLFVGGDACLLANASHSWGGASSSRHGCTAVFDVQHLTVSWTLPVDVEAVSPDGAVGAFTAQEPGGLLPARSIRSSGLFGHIMNHLQPAGHADTAADC